MIVVQWYTPVHSSYSGGGGRRTAKIKSSLGNLESTSLKINKKRFNLQYNNKGRKEEREVESSRRKDERKRKNDKGHKVICGSYYF